MILDTDDSTTDTDTGNTGNGPTINLSVSGDTLYLNVTDDDYKIKAVRYSSGLHSASEFDSGTRGNEVTLDSTGDASFTINQGGVYTFYAIDSGGHESVSAIKISLDDDNFFDGGYFDYGGYFGF
jgi:hypothetical protein